MAGRRLREAVKSALISSGGGEFDESTHVVIAGLSNAYSQYVATFEEYKQQRYEVCICALTMKIKIKTYVLPQSKPVRLQ